ncbi:class I SAM-dependent methyltransferase [Candidatus Poriferisodalis sp.]|uniref:class I SAM-dependent methyltransferase n=1 Tax=Candidatus Poriferisodalis sp. TaxID=3101277 RepID=UPI003B0286AF
MRDNLASWPRIETFHAAYAAALARSFEAKRADALVVDNLAALFLADSPVAYSRLVALLGDSADLIALRSLMFDKLIADSISEARISDILNVGAGFDTRPYRMRFADEVRLIEVDDPRVLECKTQLLVNHSSTTRLVRCALDVGCSGWFDALLEHVPDIDGAAVVAEGFFIYLSRPEAQVLMEELARSGRCRYLVGDLVSPGQLRKLRDTAERLGTRFGFYGLEDLQIFERAGWLCIDYWPMMTALRRYRPRSPIAAMMPTTVSSAAERGLIDGVAVFELL